MQSGSSVKASATSWLIALGIGTATIVAPLWLVIAGIGPTTAHAGDVTGTITVAADFGTEEPDEGAPRDHGWEEWNGLLPIAPLRFRTQDEISVVLVGEAEAPPIGCAYALRGGGLAPATIVVRTGTDLDIANHDGCAHELYVDDIEGFSAGPVAPGSGRTARMPREAGVFTIRDALYPHVRGHLHVISDLVACARLEPSGAYRFTDVEPGEYTLRAYHRAEVISERTVVVEAGSRATTVPAIRLPAEGGN